MNCPFCGEADFDPYGLKQHLLNYGWCEQFDAITEDQRYTVTDAGKAALRGES